MLVLLRQSWCKGPTHSVASGGALRTFCLWMRCFKSADCRLVWTFHTKVARQTWMHKLPIGL